MIGLERNINLNQEHINDFFFFKVPIIQAGPTIFLNLLGAMFEPNLRAEFNPEFQSDQNEERTKECHHWKSRIRFYPS